MKIEQVILLKQTTKGEKKKGRYSYTSSEFNLFLSNP